MDALITAAARALAAGDPLAALKHVSLRHDPPALALRGVAMAQLGDLTRARELLRSAAIGFGQKEPMARARCQVAEAEIALVSRDLGRSIEVLNLARATLESLGDRANAAHAGYLDARRLLLIGHIEEAERTLESLETTALPPASRVGCELVAAGIAMRRIQAAPARAALNRARAAAATSDVPVLAAEVDRAWQAFEAPAARLISRGTERMLGLDQVETLQTSDTFIVDACRNSARLGSRVIPLASRPVLLALLRTLAEAWPKDVPRQTLLARAFRARHADESHRARLRVEIGRLRETIKALASVTATKQGFVLEPHAAGIVAILAPPVEGEHAEVLAVLADGEAWSSSALALALGTSPRTALRALETLKENGKVECFGRGRACRWIAPSVPGFPTSLLLPTRSFGG
jgi:hypothetical protein